MKLKLICVAMAAMVFATLAPAADPAASEVVLIQQGDKAWAAGKTDDAKKSFEQAVAANPRSLDARMKLAGLLLSSQKYSAAEAAYQAAISLDGNNAKAWMGLGLAYRHNGKKDLSQAAFSEAVRIEPGRKAQLAQLVDEPAK